MAYEHTVDIRRSPYLPWISLVQALRFWAYLVSLTFNLRLWTQAYGFCGRPSLKLYPENDIFVSKHALLKGVDTKSILNLLTIPLLCGIVEIGLCPKEYR